MSKLLEIEAFVSVATRGGLTAAAASQDTSAVMLGRRISALEDRLGVKLLIRTTRKVSLTAEGTAYLEDCQRLLTDLANAEASVSAGGIKASGHLRVTAPAGFGRRHVAPLVAQFHALHPEVSVSLNLADRMVDLSGEGFDCGVRVGDMPDSRLVSVRLADNRRVCVATPAYLRLQGTPQTPQDLHQHRCLVLSSEGSQTRGWAFLSAPKDTLHNPQSVRAEPVEALSNQRVPLRQAQGERVVQTVPKKNADVLYLRPSGPLDCTDGQVLHEWCLSGYGIAWRSIWEVSVDLAEGRLVQVLADFSAPPNGIYAVFTERKHMPLRLRLWVDFLKAQYGREDYWR